MPKKGVLTRILSIMVEDTVGVQISAQVVSIYTMLSLAYYYCYYLWVHRRHNEQSNQSDLYNLDHHWPMFDYTYKRIN
jgi:hypothetical protein